MTLNLMKQAFVDELAWMSEEEYLQRMGVCKLLPGPVSSIMSLILGRKFFGFWASLAGLVCYILPAFLIVLGWIYCGPIIQEAIPVSFRLLLINNFKLYIVCAIFIASFKLMMDSWKSFKLKNFQKVILFSLIIGMAVGSILLKRIEIEIIIYALILGLLAYTAIDKGRPKKLYSFSIFGILALFFIASVIVFGTGYMIFPYLERELVAKGIMSLSDFNAALMLGNLSPGPVIIACTYFGYVLGGLGGAIAATIGVFGGPVVIVSLGYTALEKLRKYPIVSFLSLCVVPAVVVVLLNFNLTLLKDISFSKVTYVIGLLLLVLQYKKLNFFLLLMFLVAVSALQM